MPDLEIAEEAIPETPLMMFSRMGRQQLLREAKARGLTGYASLSNPDLIDRLVQHDQQQIPPEEGEEEAPLIDGVDGDFGPEFDEGGEDPAAEEVASTSAAGSPPAGWQGALADRVEQDRARAAAPPQAAPQPRDQFAAPTRASVRPQRARTGFDEATSTYREEFPIGNRDVDDATHFDCIQGTHKAATDAGYRTRGAPWAGQRVGYSRRQGMRTVIYEVSARTREE